MARSMRFKANLSGYRDVLNGSEMQGILDATAGQIRDAATAALSEDWGAPPRDEHFEVGEWTAKTGATARYIRAHTEHAKRSESKHKTLTKAVGAAEI